MDFAKLPGEIPGLGPSSTDSAKPPRACMSERMRVQVTLDGQTGVAWLLYLEPSTEGPGTAVSVGAGDPRRMSRVSKNQRCVQWLTTSQHLLQQLDWLIRNRFCMIPIINWLLWNLPFQWWCFCIKTKILPWLGSFLSHILSWKHHSPRALPPPVTLQNFCDVTCGDTRT